MKVDRNTIQVMTPYLTMYIGELEPGVSALIMDSMVGGLLRAEGFIERLSPEEVS